MLVKLLKFIGYLVCLVGGLIVLEGLIKWRRRVRAKRLGGRAVCDCPTPAHRPVIGVFAKVPLRNLKGWVQNLSRKLNYETWALVLPLANQWGIVTSDPADIKHILRDPIQYPKGQGFRDMFFDFLGHGIFNSDDEEWRRHRKVASHLFSAKKLRGYAEDTFSRDARECCRLLLGQQGGKQEIDFQSWMTAMTFQSFVAIAFGKEFGELKLTAETGGPSPFSAAFDKATLNIGLRIIIPWWRFNKLFQLGTEARLTEALAEVKPFIRRLVQERLAEEAGSEQHRGDMISLYLEHARRTGDETMLTRAYLCDVASNLMLAARDTSASLLTSAVRMMSNHPEWRDRLEAEADRLLAADADVAIGYDLVKRAELLDAFLLETGRLFPPVSTDFKDAQHVDLLPSGVVVEPGDRITYHIAGVCESPAVWGEDAAVFDPSRWLDGTKRGPPATCAPHELAWSYPVFNAGPRLCLGKRLAMVEAKILLMTLFQHRLRFQCSEFVADSHWDNMFTSSAVIFLRRGLKGVVTRR